MIPLSCRKWSQYFSDACPPNCIVMVLYNRLHSTFPPKDAFYMIKVLEQHYMFDHISLELTKFTLTHSLRGSKDWKPQWFGSCCGCRDKPNTSTSWSLSHCSDGSLVGTADDSRQDITSCLWRNLAGIQRFISNWFDKKHRSGTSTNFSKGSFVIKDTTVQWMTGWCSSRIL